ARAWRRSCSTSAICTTCRSARTWSWTTPRCGVRWAISDENRGVGAWTGALAPMSRRANPENSAAVVGPDVENTPVMPRAIKIQYDLKLTDGSLIESATLSFVPGRDQILPALERKIIGLSPGEEVAGILPAREAFGDPELLPIADLKRNEFPADTNLDIG